MLTFAAPSAPHIATDRRPRAVVIGSGFGGLAAAVRLGAAGYRVTILEKLDVPGGRAAVMKRGGFTFDLGPTIITAPFLFEELWALCGRRMSDEIELRRMRPFYEIRFANGDVFHASDNEESMRAEVARFNAPDVSGYERFMRRSAEIYRLGFEQLGDAPFGAVKDMARIAPDLARLEGWRSVYGLAAKYLSDERLRIVFSFHPLLIGGNPFRASAIYCLISYLERRWGVHFAMGGTGALVNGLVNLIEGQGGEIRFGSEVERILVEDGLATGVALTSGETIPARIVVSNADSAWTYRKLVPASARRRWTDRKIDAQRYSMGLFVWHFGVNRRYGGVPHHSILLGPRYRELLRDVFDRKVLAEDFSLYLHRPTATDPSLAPKGCDTFYVLSPVPNLQGGQDWRLEAEPYRRRIARALEATVLPGLSQTVVASHVATPLDFERRLNAYRGAGFSLEPTLTQSAWFRPHNKSEDVGNLFLVGAGTHPGAGLPGVLSSARVLDKVAPHASVFA
jgi:phytoene desaturase